MLSLSLKPTYSNRYIIRLSVSLSTAHPPTRKRLLFFCHHTPTPMNTKPFFLSLSLLHIHTHFLYLFALHSYCNVNKFSYTILSHDCSCARYWRKSATHNWPVLNAFHVVSHSLSLFLSLSLSLIKCLSSVGNHSSFNTCCRRSIWRFEIKSWKDNFRAINRSIYVCRERSSLVLQGMFVIKTNNCGWVI